MQRMPEQEPFNSPLKKENSEHAEVQKQFEYIQFLANTDKRGNKYYVSSSPDRKMIELDPSSEIPDGGTEYIVEIIRDTKPEDPNKGKYIGKIIGVSEKSLTPSEWRKIEDSVDTIAPMVHKGRLVSRELYQETNKARQEEEAGVSSADIVDADRALVIEELEKERKEIDEEIGGILDGPLAEGTPGKRLVDFEKMNLIRAIRQYREYERTEEQLRIRETQMKLSVDRAKRSGEPTVGKEKVLDRIRGEIEEITVAKQMQLNENPEAFYGVHLLELKREKEAYEHETIVELPSVKENIDDIVSHLRGGEPVLLYGHYGTGKTELAMHVARKYLKKDALVISGSKDTSLADLYGHHVLKIDKTEADELQVFMDKVEHEYNAWTTSNPSASEEDKDRAHERILQTYLTTLGTGTVTEFMLGKVNQAIVEDRPIIIDEVNAIPHETLISLNHLLTRRVGTKMQLQRDSNREVVIGEGYNVIMTGNLGRGEDKYVDRQQMDPAFLSRAYKKEIDYLPQTREGTLREAGGHNELFRLMVARLMDRHGNLEIPQESIDKLWDFAKVCRVFQDAFAGKNLGNAFYKRVAGGPAKPYFLQESVPSHREIRRVLDQWQREDFKHELDYYIWREFFSQSMNQADREYMYQIMHEIYGFFDSSVYSNIVAENSVKNAPLSLQKEFYGPRQTVGFVFGEGPTRKKWPGRSRKKK